MPQQHERSKKLCSPAAPVRERVNLAIEPLFHESGPSNRVVATL